MVYGGRVYGVWWITTVVIIRPSQPSLAGVGAGAELGKMNPYPLINLKIKKTFSNFFIKPIPIKIQASFSTVKSIRLRVLLFVPHLYHICGTCGTNINVPHFCGTNYIHIITIISFLYIYVCNIN